MTFPSSLLENERPKYPREYIRNWHFMYARHKPGHAWITEEDIPDFTKIQIPSTLKENEAGKGQSFNWNIFSIPIWARFDDKKKYLESYGVVAYSVRSIRLTADVLAGKSKSGITVDNGALDLEHSPNPNNYSHCHITLRTLLSREQRREARMAIKHNSYVSLRPDRKQGRLSLLWDRFCMKGLQIVSLGLGRMDFRD